MSQPENPVLQRIEVLSSQWRSFATHERARVLEWRLEPDEVRMVDAFMAMQLDERTAEHPDLFITLESAFTTPEPYAEHLGAELTEQYRTEQYALQAEGLTADWTPPERQSKDTNTSLLVRSCASFASHHALPRHLVLVLRPREVSDRTAYRTWLVGLAASLPGGVRVLTFDAAGAPAWELDDKATQHVNVRTAALDMPGAYAEVSRKAGQLDTPGGKFRDTFLKLAAAVSAKDLSLAASLGDAILSIADTQRWFHMQVPVHSMLATALAADGKASEAESRYLAAEQSALRGQTEGDPESRDTCKKLRLQSRLGLGSVLMTGERYADAARVFAETIPIALEAGDDAVRLDCYRLAAFCHECAEAPETGFRWAYDGLAVAKQLPADVLSTSNLPHLGETLLRLCEPAGRSGMRDEIKRDLEALTELADTPQTEGVA